MYIDIYACVYKKKQIYTYKHLYVYVYIYIYTCIHIIWISIYIYIHDVLYWSIDLPRKNPWWICISVGSGPAGGSSGDRGMPCEWPGTDMVGGFDT